MIIKRPTDATRARELRSQPTEMEIRLWHQLRNRKLLGLKFRRQVPLGRYVVDFVCLEESVVIEVDGGQHALATRYERDRQHWLEEHGWRVLRFWNNEVKENLAGVLEVIAQALRPGATSPHPHPLPQAGEGQVDRRA
jgi:very-short-patch-repair endonuclease